MMPTVTRHSLLPVLAVAMLTSFAFLGSRPVIGTSEGRYAACAQEMLSSGDFMHPTLNGVPHWTKPPLTYWAITAGVRLLGYNGWGVRLFNALAFVGTSLLIALLGRRLGGPHLGLLAGTIYASAAAPVLASWVTTTDTLLTLWMTAAVFCWVAAAQARDRTGMNGWLALCGLALGLGFMTKGPPVLLALFALVARPIRPLRRAWPGFCLLLLAFIVVGLSWYLRVCQTHPGLWGYFVGEELVNRFRASADAAEVRIKIHNDEWYKAFSVYGPVLIGGLGLWIIPVGMALGRLRTGLWTALRSQSRLRFHESL